MRLRVGLLNRSEKVDGIPQAARCPSRSAGRDLVPEGTGDSDVLSFCPFLWTSKERGSLFLWYAAELPEHADCSAVWTPLEGVKWGFAAMTCSYN